VIGSEMQTSANCRYDKRLRAKSCCVVIGSDSLEIIIRVSGVRVPPPLPANTQLTEVVENTGCEDFRCPTFCPTNRGWWGAENGAMQGEKPTSEAAWDVVAL
jgi:hypothetical protein